MANVHEPETQHTEESSEAPLHKKFRNKVPHILLLSLCVIVLLIVFHSPISSKTLRSRLSTTPTTLNSNPSPSPTPRVALCITGNARTFHHPLVHQAILANVLAPLNAHHVVDVFFNIKLDDNPRPRRPTARAFHEANLAAMALFNPVSILLLNSSHDFNNSRADSTRRTILPPANCTTPFRNTMLPHALFRSSQCLPLILRHERQRGFRYSFIYKTRPDVVFLDPIIPPDALANGSVVTNIGPRVYMQRFATYWKKKQNLISSKRVPAFADHFMAGMRHDMIIALQAVDAINDCEFFRIGPNTNSEAALGYWILSHALVFDVRDWTWVLVRAKKGPECSRIRLMELPEDRRHQMDAQCNAFYKTFHEAETPTRR